eukprot:scaffold187021_cov17-Tisochrysis_lutea.AAC.2
MGAVPAPQHPPPPQPAASPQLSQGGPSVLDVPTNIDTAGQMQGVDSSCCQGGSFSFPLLPLPSMPGHQQQQQQHGCPSTPPPAPGHAMPRMPEPATPQLLP